MTTPVSGQISFSSLRSEIMQSGSGQLRLRADAGNRLGYGSATNVKMSDLYRSWGATFASDAWQDKFSNQFYGCVYNFSTGLPVYSTGIDDTTPMAGMNVNAIYTNSSGSSALLELIYPAGGAEPYTTYPTANIDRLCTANTLRTVTSVSSSGSFQYANWDNGAAFPSSNNTVTLGLRWINPGTGGGGGGGGGGGCCFANDTEITMADGTVKLVNTIQVGDLILSYNEETQQNETNEVSEIITRVNRVMYEFHLENGTIIKGSQDHPFYVVGKGYCSMNPTMTMGGYKSLTNVQQIQVGDKLVDKDRNEILLVDIIPIDLFDTVYTFNNKYKTSPNFYANGVLVY